MTTLFFILALAIGFTVLIWGADRFVDGAASIATNVGISPLLVGLTIVAFGTSAPEILVAVLASFDGAPALGIGNAIGSNIANIGLVLGVTTLVAPLTIQSATLKREFPLLAFIMAVALFLVWDYHLGYMDGLILFAGFIITLFGMAYLAVKSSQSDPLKQEFEQELAIPSMTTCQAILSFTLGLTALLIGSKALVWGAVGVAQLLGVSDLVIGLTIVAIGTSLPELAASIISALKNEHDLAVGNIVGSNMFNILAVLAMPGLIQPSAVSPALLQRDFPVMIGLFVVLYFFARIPPNGWITRFTGVILLFIYISYNALLAYTMSV